MVLYARDIVEKEFLSLTEESTVMDAAKAMKARKRGFVLVGSAASPRGIVTEWDILSKVVSEGLDPVKVTLGDVMTRDLLSIDGGAGLAAVSQLMSEHGVRRLLVKEHDQVIGYITSRTMLARMNDYVDKVSSQISLLQAPWF
ncbi:MAG: CBS domain-containing protein [Nitrososphaerota archaeon]|nr:CBS domain-containing protein [Nitrososphaerota archaeon]MDG6959430.1 CBS domain-containing protein [Nitrososphaerota archaeon]MDG7014817.1 CBS domain-containing protein [Nitrososphaerota archaeon]WGO50781.1 MAG: CBS domain-containing protein [Nitrososphaerota archaeon]